MAERIKLSDFEEKVLNSAKYSKFMSGLIAKGNYAKRIWQDHFCKGVKKSSNIIYK